MRTPTKTGGGCCVHGQATRRRDDAFGASDRGRPIAARLRREAGSHTAIVAFGDRPPMAAWQTIDLADALGTDGDPGGLALTRGGRAIVALDTKKPKENLVLLEPAIAEGRAS